MNYCLNRAGHPSIFRTNLLSTLYSLLTGAKIYQITCFTTDIFNLTAPNLTVNNTSILNIGPNLVFSSVNRDQEHIKKPPNTKEF